jgi:hypothetical protein
LHKYIYANSNPSSFTDPSGLFAALAESNAAFAVFAILATIKFAGITTGSYNPERLGGIGADAQPRTVLDGLFAWRNTWSPEPLGGIGAGSQPSVPTHTGRPADAIDLAQYIFESSFRGPAAKDFDWTHITNNHSEWGKVAQQSGKKDIFYGLTEAGIKRTVMNAWKNREKLETQDDFIKEERRIKYNGMDPETGYIVEMWFNQNTKTVETAYPIGKS